MSLRATKLVVAGIWSLAIAWFGCWLWGQPEAAMGLAGLVIGWDRPRPGQVAGMLALAFMAGGCLTFMCFVADDLCPDAPMLVTDFFKLLTGMLMAGTGLWIMWVLLWST